MDSLQELADRILYTPAWEAAQLAVILIGLGSLVVIVFGIAESPRARLLAWTGIGLMILGVIASMFFEEIVFTWPELPASRRLPYALGLTGFLLFTVMFIYSGSRLIRDGLFTQFPLLFRRGPERAEAVRTLRPGFLWGLASAAVFTVSLVGYHGLDLILGRAVTAGAG